MGMVAKVTASTTSASSAPPSSEQGPLSLGELSVCSELQMPTESDLFAAKLL